ELCYGQGERCAVSMTEATGPGAAGGQARVIAASRETLGLALADKPGGLGYVFRDGVWVTVQARGRHELLPARGAPAAVPLCGVRPVRAHSKGGMKRCFHAGQDEDSFIGSGSLAW